jgi:GH25 family lysozyme M1 (1,4-beta-N-acetylmuramidase)
MFSRRWVSSGLAAVVTAGLATLAFATPVHAADPLPDGGGWAHAGSGPAGAAPPKSAGAAAQPGVATPPGYSVAGVDVSSHDHSTYPIDWPGVAASGVSFAYVKATEGQFYTNPYFAADNQASKAAGLLTGAYTFGRPDLRDPVGDANYFIDHAAWTNDSHTLVPFLDMEWPYASLGLPTCYGLSTQEMTTWIQQFLNQVKVRIGRNGMIYTATSWWNQCTGSSTAFGGYPLDIANYSGSPGTMPSGWATWTIWQYGAGNNSQPGNYDTDVFNGDYNALRRLAGIDPPPPLTSKPAVIFHASVNQTEVYANAGGGLVERVWRPGDGWSGWSNFGGNLTGTPALLNNPRFGSTEVYANANHHLMEKYWINGVWSAWIDLGGSIAGDPAVFYNARYGSTEIYARSTSNTIVYKYYGNGWSDWIDLGGSPTGDPTVFYNPNYGTTELYANFGGHVSEKYFQPGNGWSGWIDLGGSATGDPALLYNPNYGTTEVYANFGGHVSEKYFQPGNGWSGWIDLGGNATGDPCVVYNPAYHTTEVYANTGGHAEERYYQPGNGWSGWNDLGGSLTDDPVVYRDPANGNTEIYANAGGNLVEKYWSVSQSAWSGWMNITQ